MSSKSNLNRSNVQAAIWLIGIGILWWTDLWWPGILILVGVSMLAQVLAGSASNLPQGTPAVQGTPEAPASEKVEDKTEAEKAEPWLDEEAETPTFLQKEKLPGDAARLPEKCPACGGPVAENAHKVEWMGEHTARCPFCNTVIKI